jgi:probable rRNA maturation factor
VPPRSPDLHLVLSAQSGKAHAPYLRRHLLKAHAILRPVLEELSIAIVNDRAMASLHDRFLKINSPTDVLTFELDHDDRGKIIAGEVIICLDEAQRQAKFLGTKIREELLLYAIHGMLHLCGFDDKTARGFEAMHAKEDEILTALKIGPIFARHERSPGNRDGVV